MQDHVHIHMFLLIFDCFSFILILTYPPPCLVHEGRVVRAANDFYITLAIRCTYTFLRQGAAGLSNFYRRWDRTGPNLLSARAMHKRNCSFLTLTIFLGCTGVIGAICAYGVAERTMAGIGVVLCTLAQRELKKQQETKGNKKPCSTLNRSQRPTAG